MSSTESIIYYAQGYLKALSRIAKNKNFALDIFDVNEDLESSIKRKLLNWSQCTKFKSKIKINYKTIQEFLHSNIYQFLSQLNDSEIGNIDWDIKEFFGLIANSLNSNSNLHPLITNGGYLIKIESKKYNNLMAIIVPIENQAIILSVNDSSN